jgi:hypothetical protein
MTSGEEFNNWRKSERSNGSGACVETASNGGEVRVRDTADRAAGALSFTADVWQAFLGTLR